MSFKTTECVTKCGWTVLPHLPYSPNLVPSDFYLFGPLKEGLLRQYFLDINAVIDAVKKWTATVERQFCQCGIQALVHCGKKCIENGGDCIENKILEHNVCLI